MLLLAQQKEQLVFQILTHHIPRCSCSHHFKWGTRAVSSSRREWRQTTSFQKCKCCSSAKEHYMPGLWNVPEKETFIIQSPSVFWVQTFNWKTTTNVQALCCSRDLNLDATAYFIRSNSLENWLGRKTTLENKLHVVLCFCYSKSIRISATETVISSSLSNRKRENKPTEKISIRQSLSWCLYLAGYYVSKREHLQVSV